MATFLVQGFATVTIEADNEESARQLIRDIAGQYNPANTVLSLSECKSNDNGSVFGMITVQSDNRMDAL